MMSFILEFGLREVRHLVLVRLAELCRGQI